jgi:hypothetical protein
LCHTIIWKSAVDQAFVIVAAGSALTLAWSPTLFIEVCSICAALMMLGSLLSALIVIERTVPLAKTQLPAPFCDSPEAFNKLTALVVL